MKEMNRRRFFGAGLLASFCGFFFPQKVKGSGNQEFCVGDSVKVTILRQGSRFIGNMWTGYISYISYITPNFMKIETGIDAKQLCNTDNGWCVYKDSHHQDHEKILVDIQHISPEEVI